MQREIKKTGMVYQTPDTGISIGYNPIQRENKWQDRFMQEFSKRKTFLSEYNYYYNDKFESEILAFIQSEIDLTVKEEREIIGKLLS